MVSARSPLRLGLDKLDHRVGLGLDDRVGLGLDDRVGLGLDDRVGLGLDKLDHRGRLGLLDHRGGEWA